MLLLALLPLGVGLLLTLSHDTQRVAGRNNVVVSEGLHATTGSRSRFCQRSERLPEGAEAIRVSISSDGRPGPAVSARFVRGDQVVSSGQLEQGWSGKTATIPLRQRLDRTVEGATMCVVVSPGSPVTLRGSRGSLASTWNEPFTGVDDRPPGWRMRVDYLASGRESWWAYAPTIVERIGFNSAFGNPWAGLLVLSMLVALSVLVAMRLAQDRHQDRRTVRRVPTAAWFCLAVAVLNSAVWGIVSPPFQFLDEQDHFAYVQRIAERGSPPTNPHFEYSRELSVALHGLRFLSVREDRANVPIWSKLERQRLDSQLSARPSRTDHSGAGTATAQPPLSYALEAIPYRLAAAGTILQRVALIRLLSALLAGVTALFVFLFLREALPARPWLWTVGGLAAALQPQFGYAAAAISPDSLLFAISAALFYCVARALRRGTTTRLSSAIGLLLAGGLLTKYSFAGLVPGVVLAVAVVALRQARSEGRDAWWLAGLTATAALVPLVIVGILNTKVWGRPALGVGAAVPGFIKQSSGAPGNSLPEELSFIWQFYLPRIPGLPGFLDTAFPTKEFWLRGFVGSFGWYTITFPRWVTNVALIPAVAVVGLAVSALARHVRGPEKRLADLAIYAVMIGGLLGLIGAVEYSSFTYTAQTAISAGWYGQSRYLLPLLAPFAAVLALAVRGGKRSWITTIGIVLVVLALAHDIFSVLLVVSTYYS